MLNNFIISDRIAEKKKLNCLFMFFYSKFDFQYKISFRGTIFIILTCGIHEYQ